MCVAAWEMLALTAQGLGMGSVLPLPGRAQSRGTTSGGCGPLGNWATAGGSQAYAWPPSKGWGETVSLCANDGFESVEIFDYFFFLNLSLGN